MKRSDRPAVGIDLGTTHSVIAYMEAGRPTTILNGEGELTTPSAVYFHAGGPVVGREAVKSAPYEPQLVARFAKRDVGRVAYHALIGGAQVPPEVIEGLVLRKLKEDAGPKVGEVGPAVITVPAFFNEPRRKATQDAGWIAGLQVLEIINEPTAAAIALGVQEGFLTSKGAAEKGCELILVYDLGGGTFDVTLMEIEGGRYQALATAGDVYLGGLDWDRRIVDQVAEAFLAEYGMDPRKESAALQTLLQEAQEAKHALTARADAVVHFAHDGQRLRFRLTRDEFETFTADLLQRTAFTVRKVLRDAGISWKDVTRVLLVGGSTRMPMVQRMLQDESGIQIDRSLSPDEAVAHGAAIYANLLAAADEAQRPQIVVTNVNSHDLGVLGIEPSTGRKRRKVLVPRNTRLPAKGTGRFVTRRDCQPSVVVNVIEGGDASGRNATLIGKCVVANLPPDMPAGTPVEVTFAYATNGRLTVRANLPNAERQVTMSIERTAGLSGAAVEEWRRRIEEGLLVERLQPATTEATPVEPELLTGEELAEYEASEESG